MKSRSLPCIPTKFSLECLTDSITYVYVPQELGWRSNNYDGLTDTAADFEQPNNRKVNSARVKTELPLHSELLISLPNPEEPDSDDTGLDIFFTRGSDVGSSSSENESIGIDTENLPGAMADKAQNSFSYSSKGTLSSLCGSSSDISLTGTDLFQYPMKSQSLPCIPTEFLFEPLIDNCKSEELFPAPSNNSDGPMESTPSLNLDDEPKNQSQHYADSYRGIWNSNQDHTNAAGEDLERISTPGSDCVDFSSSLSDINNEENDSEYLQETKMAEAAQAYEGFKFPEQAPPDSCSSSNFLELSGEGSELLLDFCPSSSSIQIHYPTSEIPISLGEDDAKESQVDMSAILNITGLSPRMGASFPANSSTVEMLSSMRPRQLRTTFPRSAVQVNRVNQGPAPPPFRVHVNVSAMVAGRELWLQSCGCGDAHEMEVHFPSELSVFEEIDVGEMALENIQGPVEEAEPTISPPPPRSLTLDSLGTDSEGTEGSDSPATNESPNFADANIASEAAAQSIPTDTHILNTISSRLDEIIDLTDRASDFTVHFDQMVKSSAARMKEITRAMARTTEIMRTQTEFLSQEQEMEDKVPPVVDTMDVLGNPNPTNVGVKEFDAPASTKAVDF